MLSSLASFLADPFGIHLRELSAPHSKRYRRRSWPSLAPGRHHRIKGGSRDPAARAECIRFLAQIAGVAMEAVGSLIQIVGNFAQLPDVSGSRLLWPANRCHFGHYAKNRRASPAACSAGSGAAAIGRAAVIAAPIRIPSQS